MSTTAEVDIKQEEYYQLVEQVRELVSAVLPENATVIVASTGDESLLNLAGRRAWHFPRMRKGQYPRYYLPDSSAAIAHLEKFRAQGAEYFVVPHNAFWWLEYYDGFAQYLARYRLVARQYHVAIDLRVRCEPSAARPASHRLTSIIRIAVAPGWEGAGIGVKTKGALHRAQPSERSTGWRRGILARTLRGYA